MPFVIDDANLPATLTSQPMTDDEFTAFCAEHPDLNFEMTAEGELIVTAPAHSFNGVFNSDINAQLTQWAKKDRRGFVCDSSTGVVLPNGARRSPDASWILKTRVLEMDLRTQKSFWHLCPDFVIEVKSDSDRFPALQKKMREYLEQGAQLGWLINPENKTVEIHRPTGTVETLANPKTLAGEGPVEGFTLDLTHIWNPFAG